MPPPPQKKKKLTSHSLHSLPAKEGPTGVVKGRNVAMLNNNKQKKVLKTLDAEM